MSTVHFAACLRRSLLRGAALLALGVGLPLAAVPVSVVAVESGAKADVVVLDGGYQAGLRSGMVCRVVRDTAEVGEVLLVEVRPSVSAALILSLAPRQSVRPGDAAAVKLFKS